jgi:hypothetical protein
MHRECHVTYLVLIETLSIVAYIIYTLYVSYLPLRRDGSWPSGHMTQFPYNKIGPSDQYRESNMANKTGFFEFRLTWAIMEIAPPVSPLHPY